MITRLLLLSFFWFTATYVQGQSSIPKVDPKIFSEQITPINPDVATLGSYSMSPPSFSNGLPQQNIALFEIKENGINYPLNLFYNYSGFKVKEEASSVGLGWGLTDGMIMRIVKHLPDEHTGLLKKYSDFGNSSTEEWGLGLLDFNYFTNSADATSSYSYTQNRLFYKLYDGQPDLYIYNYAGHKGTFLWIDGVATKMDHNDVVITGHSLSGYLTFTITTTDGNQATFTPADRITTNPTNVVRPHNCDLSHPLETYTDYGYNTAWRLVEIKNLTTKAKLTFSYVSNYTTQQLNISQLTSLTLAAPKRIDGSYYTTDFQKDETFSSTTTESYYPQAIESDNYKVVFTTKARSDGGEYRIDSIKIFNKLNLSAPVKTIAFTQTYFGDVTLPTTCWLKLKKIHIAGGGIDKTYGFSYLDEFQNLAGMDKEGLSIDHWGYFNNIPNTTLVPLTGNIVSQLATASNLNTSIIAWANRDVSFTYVKSFSLDTVYYPTGGFTKINYQSAYGKGIQVASQEDNDGRQSIYKYYQYDSGAPFTFTPNYEFTEYYTKQCCGAPDATPPHTRITTYSSNQFGSPDFFKTQEIFHDSVTEFIGSPTGIGGKTIYTYRRLTGLSNEAILTSTSHYKYGDSNPISSEHLYYSTPTLHTFNYWKVPELQSTGLPSGECSADPIGNRFTCCPSDSLVGYILGDMAGGIQQTYSWWMRLDSVENITDGVRQFKAYSYMSPDSVSGLPFQSSPTTIREILPDGRSKYSYFYYAGQSDPDNGALTLGIPQMWDWSNAHFKNYLPGPIKTKTVLGGNLISQQTNIYSYDATGDYLFKTGYESLPAGQESGKEQWALTYDSARVVDIAKGTNAGQSYIWGYHQQYPIAEVIGASASKIAYSSFEADSWGGWTANSGSTINYNTIALTGNNTLGGGVHKTVPSGNYIVSAWTTGAPTVNGEVISSSPLKQIGSWKYYEIKLSSVTSVQIEAATIDEVRLYPVGAQMNTYTYNPALGMTTHCDQKNNILYYEYDSFGRLLHVRDEHKNILKKMDYQYQVLP